MDHKLYGLHSLRSGGATSAFSCNRNLSERVLKLHRRWKYDTAKDMYILARFLLVGLPEHPTINLLYLVIYEINVMVYF